MIKGLIGRRASHRVPFEAEVNIKFEVEGSSPVLAVANNISSGGLQFTLPKGKIKFAPEDPLELIFHLPGRGDTTIHGEICYFANTADAFGNPQICYGVKFLDLNLELWQSINEYCTESLDPKSEAESETKSSASENVSLQPEQDLSPVHSLSQDRIDDILQKIVPIAPKQEKKLQASAQKPSSPKSPLTDQYDIDTGLSETPPATGTTPVFSSENDNLSQAVNQFTQLPPKPEISFTNSQETPDKTVSNQSEKNLSNKTKPSLPEIQQNLIDLIYGAVAPAGTEENTEKNRPDQRVTNSEVIKEPLQPEAVSLESAAAKIGEPTTPESVSPVPTPNLNSDLLINQNNLTKMMEDAPSGSPNLPEHQATPPIPVQPVIPPPVAPKETAPIPVNSFPVKENPGFNPAIFKSSSLASMDQDMIDHIVRNLSHTSSQQYPSPTMPEGGPYNSNVHISQSRTIMAKLQLPDGRAISGLVEQLNFTGVKLRLPEKIMVNSQISIDLFEQELSIHNLSGTCTSCKQQNSEGVSQAEIFFKSLSQDQQIKIQSLITKLR